METLLPRQRTRARVKWNRKVIIYVFIMLEGPSVFVFAFVALSRVSSSSSSSSFEFGGCRQQCANVYQIEKDVMYLNLIYVYLVTERRKCLFNGKLIQFGNLQTSFSTASADRPTPDDGKENKEGRKTLK